jgi:hypothetical protein
VITAHRILIGAGIAFFLFYAMVVLMRDHTVTGFVHRWFAGRGDRARAYYRT